MTPFFPVVLEELQQTNSTPSMNSQYSDSFICGPLKARPGLQHSSKWRELRNSYFNKIIWPFYAHPRPRD